MEMPVLVMNMKEADCPGSQRQALCDFDSLHCNRAGHHKIAHRFLRALLPTRSLHWRNTPATIRKVEGPCFSCRDQDFRPLTATVA